MAVIPLTRIQNWLYPFRFIGRVWIFLALEANTDMLRVGAMLVLNIQFVSNTLEITTVNQKYLEGKNLLVQTLQRGFAWLDTGTHDSLSEASTFIEVIEKRQGLKVACLEEIAYKRGWIDKVQLRKLAEPMAKNDYGKYLLKI